VPDPFDDIDPGQDFEDFAVGQERVTVRSVDPIDPDTALAEVDDLPAVGQVRVSATVGARTGEVGHSTNTIWVRCDLLGFTLKPRDQIEAADGTVWLCDEIELCGARGVYAVSKCTVTLSRSH
jgi:hypothetical protein